MKTTISALAATAVLCVTVAGLLAAPARAAVDPPRLLEVRGAYQACRTIRQAKATTKITLYGTYRNLETQQAPTWHRSRPKDGHTLETMTVYKTGGRIRAADYWQGTPSGDWSKVTRYCFRGDGSLAFALSELRTFQGNVRVVDRLYFDPAGRRIRALRALFDLDTKKPIKKAQAGFHDQKTTIYLTGDRVAAAVGLPVGDAHAQPRFSDYPAKVTYSGKPAPVDLASHRDAHRFRTNLRRGAARGPNFSGAYTVVTWGCGTACQMIAVVDARTGKVAFASDAASAGVTFRRGSRLLVFNADQIMNRPARYLVFKNGAFRKVR